MKSKSYTLGEVCKFIDYRGKTPPKTNQGIPLITAKIVKNGFVQEPTEFIDENLYDSWMRRGIPKKGDVIFTTEAPLGEVAQIKTDKKLAFAQRIIILEPNDEILDSSYLFYALQDFTLKSKILVRESGTTVSGIKAQELKKVIIDLPSLKQQRNIGYILSTIDDKIELNNQINKNLEQQAQAIFKSWFIDFEPFDEKILESWSKIKLNHIAKITTNTFSSMKNKDIIVEHYSIPAFDDKHYPIFESTNSIKSNKYILNKNSVIISKLNPNIKRIWRPICLSNYPICSTEFIVYESINPKYKDFIYSILNSLPFYDYICLNVTGTTNSHQRTNPKLSLDYEFLLPTEEIINNFCSIVTPMYDLISSNLIENQNLINMRDTLLPKLISGKIDVSKIII